MMTLTYNKFQLITSTPGRLDNLAGLDDLAGPDFHLRGLFCSCFGRCLLQLALLILFIFFLNTFFFILIMNFILFQILIDFHAFAPEVDLQNYQIGQPWEEKQAR